MRAGCWSSLAIVLVLSSACGPPNIAGHRGVLGAPIRATVDGVPKSLNGELLAVGEDTVWVAVEERLQHAILSQVGEARIERSSQGMSHGLLRGVVFGLLTGAAMTAACNSVEGGGCGGIFVGSAAISTIFGLLAGADNESRRFLRLERPTAPTLVPWARYPQGLPTVIRESGRIPSPAPRP